MSGSSVVCMPWCDSSILSTKSWADMVEEEEEIARKEQATKRQRSVSHNSTKRSRAKRRRVNSAGKDDAPDDLSNVQNKIDNSFLKTLESLQLPPKIEDSTEGTNKRVFVGGIPFKDLEEVEKRYKEENKENATTMPFWEIRLKCILLILQEFGEVNKMKLNRRRRHCEFEFVHSSSAEAAIAGLSVRGSRVNKEREMRANLKKSALPPSIAPASKFYLRRPRATTTQESSHPSSVAL
eukprot:CAMPEP_0174251816 /NCGR_PEP_ID=MMETSP0439-20130205/1522_1 /TAXON_ID=0 /ORGANISM="Stereomyxa ramosa, Strain Chinc5" /LENGTH=237 /DNA_ID=CAMNT_0015332235 /DNA_START=44 /DNA_END=757 /DNA_ORIENTATION=-